MPDFDLIVIGSGPGGYVAAIRAAQLGLKTAIVEKTKTLGGTCLNIGCIPSKALLNSSHHFSSPRRKPPTTASSSAMSGSTSPTMLKRKDKPSPQLTGGVAFLMKKNKVTVFAGEGRITAPGKVTVTGGRTARAQELNAKHIILATGSVPIELPTMPVDGKTVVTSTEALSFDTVPKQLVVIGGGAIGLELGSVWARLGRAGDRGRVSPAHRARVRPRNGPGRCKRRSTEEGQQVPPRNQGQRHHACRMASPPCSATAQGRQGTRPRGRQSARRRRPQGDPGQRRRPTNSASRWTNASA